MIAYLATPFSRYPDGHEAAFREAARITGELTKCGRFVFSPIVHGYPLCQHAGLPLLDAELWTKIDREFLELCSECIVAKMDGWQQSSGVREEVAYFINRDLPVSFLDPATMKIAPGIIYQDAVYQPNAVRPC